LRYAANKDHIEKIKEMRNNEEDELIRKELE
jgi:hypothetical protein